MRVSWFDSYWVEVSAERIKGIKVGTWGPSWEGEVRATEEISEIEVRRESEEEVEVDWREGRRVSESKEGKRLEVDEVVGIRVAVQDLIAPQFCVLNRLRGNSERTDSSNSTFPYCSP